jgi:hypothetical protein
LDPELSGASLLCILDVINELRKWMKLPFPEGVCLLLYDVVHFDKYAYLSAFQRIVMKTMEPTEFSEASVTNKLHYITFQPTGIYKLTAMRILHLT